MDPLAVSVDAVSILGLLVISVVAAKTVKAFQQSKQAVIESASLVGVIVDALSARIQRSEAIIVALRSDVSSATRLSESLEGQQRTLHASYDEVTRQLQEMLATDKKLIAEFEQVKSKLSQIQQRGSIGEGLPKPENLPLAASGADLLANLTPTEHETLEILKAEGPKGAPELGKRLGKSREHTARLMKKLYLEGYVNRESNHAPFRYRLNESVRSAMDTSPSPVKVERPETP